MFKWLKVSVFILLHAVAGFFFGIACEITGQAYPLILKPDLGLLNMLIIFLVSISAVIVFAGLVAALIEPLWIKAISFAVATAAILLGWGKYTWTSIVPLVLHLLIGINFAHHVGKGLKERIRFSVQPINENKTQLILALILLACASIYDNGKEYIDKYGFEIPESFFLPFMEPMKEQALSQVPLQHREEEEAKIDQQFSQMMDDLQESKVKPFEPYIPLLIAASLFFMLNSIVAIVSFLPLSIISGVVKLLRMVKLVEVVKETKEVERLVLM